MTRVSDTLNEPQVDTERVKMVTHGVTFVSGLIERFWVQYSNKMTTPAQPPPNIIKNKITNSNNGPTTINNNVQSASTTDPLPFPNSPGLL